MRRFLADFHQGKVQGRYITASLPNLPFKDDQFNLALVSHLLFLYSEQLNFDFHVASLQELLRIASEVRVFPLLNLARKPSPHVEAVCAALEEHGFRTEIRGVAYEFQRGGN